MEKNIQDGWDEITETNIQFEDTKIITNLLFDGRDILNYHYPLEPDMISGWMPKLPSCPIPLSYLAALPSVQRMKVCFKGHRFINSVQLHQSYQYKWKYRDRYDVKIDIVKDFITKVGMEAQNDKILKQAQVISQEEGNVKQSKSCCKKIGFQHVFQNIKQSGDPNKETQYCQISSTKHQQTLHHGLQFQANFQSSNLDLVLSNQHFQYFCFLRCDTNTRGHTNWYYFKVKSKGAGIYQLNISNLTKINSLYNTGMTPYSRSLTSQTESDLQWTQGRCYEVGFKEKVYGQCLEFKYEFQQNQEVEFAYSIPYTYSQLQRWLGSISNESHVKISTLCESLSGLDIPLIQVSKNSRKKRIIVISARIHPGQTNSSHMIQGFVKQLLDSKFTVDILDIVDFYIVPMINPDGVVAGNFRTSFSGKDLNRQFDSSTHYLFPQIKGLIGLVKRLKKQNGKVDFFFDFHSHSSKKGLFSYGPEHRQDSPYYLKARVLNRIMKKLNGMFCESQSSYIISEKKKNAARAYMLRSEGISMTFTYEVSNGIFVSNSTESREVGDIKRFFYNKQTLLKAGVTILQGFCEYCKLYLKQTKTKKILRIRSNHTQKKNSFKKSAYQSHETSIRNIFLDKNSYNSYTFLQSVVKDIIGDPIQSKYNIRNEEFSDSQASEEDAPQGFLQNMLVSNKTQMMSKAQSTSIFHISEKDSLKRINTSKKVDKQQKMKPTGQMKTQFRSSISADNQNLIIDMKRNHPIFQATLKKRVYYREVHTPSKKVVHQNLYQSKTALKLKKFPILF